MSRRRPDDSAVGESDSFLDIVANIVGILIILIVIVGVRVGQTTVAPPSPAKGTTPEQVAAPPVMAPIPVFVDAPPTPAPEPIPADPKLLAAIDSTQSDIERLQQEYNVAEDDVKRLALAIPQLRETAEQAKSEHAALRKRLVEIDETRDDIAAKLEGLADAKQDLHRQLSDVPSNNVTVLRHELNPIGRRVQGQELHFRLAGGRVSHVPLNDFIERLKPRIEQQKEWVVRFNRHEGRIGPYDGYTLEYVIERERMTLADELRLGSRVIRISVTGWKIVPQDTLVTETIEQALQADSRFRQTLRLADHRATLTFWVYPDSFAAYRQLQQFAYERGFAVAARPLPQGVPIAGSPDGSRSSSQ